MGVAVGVQVGGWVAVCVWLGVWVLKWVGECVWCVGGLVFK